MLFWARLKWGRLATNYLSLIFLCVNKMIIQTMINVVVSGYFGHFKGMLADSVFINTKHSFIRALLFTSLRVDKVLR